MGFFGRLRNRVSTDRNYSDSSELRAIWNTYVDQWPDNNERYCYWKPASILPAPKWSLKRAMKLCYAEWPEPIEWKVYSAFFMEFVDLALHLPQNEYAAIETFRKHRIMSCGKERDGDPLSGFHLPSSLASAQGNSVNDSSTQQILRIRNGLRRSTAWNPVDVRDDELDAVRRILLESATEFATLIEEWRFYMLSIDRDTYVA